MTISKEDLEKIKQSSKAHSIEEIIKHRQDAVNNTSDDENSGDDNNSDTEDNGDQNFISNRSSDIKPVNVDIRSLDGEVGGLEADYEEEKRVNDKDVDVWDSIGEKTNKANQEHNEQHTKVLESYIHQIKFAAGADGIIGGGKKRRKKHGLGQVDLGKAVKVMSDQQPKGFWQKLQDFKIDRSHEGGGMGL